MNNSTMAEANFFYSLHQKLGYTIKTYLLYNPLIVAQYMSADGKQTISPEDITAVEEWAYTLRVKVKGKRYTLVSKKKIHEKYSRRTETGETIISLSPRVVPIVDPEDWGFSTYIGYNDQELAEQAKTYILNDHLAQAAEVQPAGLAEGKWELQVRELRLDAVMRLGLRDLCQRAVQKWDDGT